MVVLRTRKVRKQLMSVAVEGGGGNTEGRKEDAVDVGGGGSMEGRKEDAVDVDGGGGWWWGYRRQERGYS